MENKMSYCINKILLTAKQDKHFRQTEHFFKSSCVKSSINQAGISKCADSTPVRQQMSL